MALEWSITGQPDGQVVRVPVRYTTDRWAAGWAPSTLQAIELPEWAVLALSTQQATDLAAGGVAIAEQFKLLTPLDEA